MGKPVLQIGIQPAQHKAAADAASVDEQIHVAMLRSLAPGIGAERVHVLDPIGRGNRHGNAPNLIDGIDRAITSFQA